MATYRVTFDVRNATNSGGTVLNTTVEADSDFMAAKVAEAKLRSQHRSYDNYRFSAKKIEKK